MGLESQSLWAMSQSSSSGSTIMAGTEFTPWGFFFLTAPLAITSYHTNKTRPQRHLLAPAAMITDADTNRSHGIVSALSRPSCRAAGGLRRPPESRAFPTSKLTIYLDDASSFEPSQRSFDIDYSMMRGRIGDPKASTPISRNRGRVPTNSRRHRRMPSTSNGC